MEKEKWVFEKQRMDIVESNVFLHCSVHWHAAVFSIIYAKAVTWFVLVPICLVKELSYCLYQVSFMPASYLPQMNRALSRRSLERA